MKVWKEGIIDCTCIYGVVRALQGKMIEPGHILHVSGTALGNSLVKIEVTKVPATTHIQNVYHNGVVGTYTIYEPITENEVDILLRNNYEYR